MKEIIIDGSKYSCELVQEAINPAAVLSLKFGLEVGLIVCIVLLAILGIIIGYRKTKDSEDDEGYY